MKKITYITDTRAEYGALKNLLLKLKESSEFDVSVIATGMHLSREHGYTLSHIQEDGLRIAAEVDGRIQDATNAGMSKSLGYELVGITDALVQEHPDLVLVAGDRGEALAGAIAAATLNIPVAHVSGGDTSTGATIDERMRHAITKLSDIHFPSSERAGMVLEQLGENKEMIFVVGNPGVRPVYAADAQQNAAIARKYGLDPAKPFLIVTQHPTTTEAARAGEHMEETLEALKELAVQTVLIYPNSDAGSAQSIAAVHRYEHEPWLKIHKSIPRDDFMALMAAAGAMVGNSSAGLIEAPSFSLPVVNIGSRQEGRERAANVIDAPHERHAIVAAVQRALSPEFRQELSLLVNPYAKDGADEKIVSILKDMDISPALLRRKTPPTPA